MDIKEAKDMHDWIVLQMEIMFLFSQVKLTENILLNSMILFVFGRKKRFFECLIL